MGILSLKNVFSTDLMTFDLIHVAEASLTSDCGTEKVRVTNHFFSKIYEKYTGNFLTPDFRNSMQAGINGLSGNILMMRRTVISQTTKSSLQ